MGFHFGVGAPPILVYFSGDWDVHWGYDLDFDPWPHLLGCEVLELRNLDHASAVGDAMTHDQSFLSVRPCTLQQWPLGVRLLVYQAAHLFLWLKGFLADVAVAAFRRAPAICAVHSQATGRSAPYTIRKPLKGFQVDEIALIVKKSLSRKHGEGFSVGYHHESHCRELSYQSHCAESPSS